MDALGAALLIEIGLRMGLFPKDNSQRRAGPLDDERNVLTRRPVTPIISLCYKTEKNNGRKDYLGNLP